MPDNDSDVLRTHIRYGLRTPDGVIHWDSYRLDDNVFVLDPAQARYVESARVAEIIKKWLYRHDLSEDLIHSYDLVTSEILQITKTPLIVGSLGDAQWTQNG